MHKLRAILPYLHVFSCVAAHKSFTRASLELCVTQSSVSYQIKKLEEAVGHKLFDRSTRGQLSLTSTGNVLYSSCTRMFDELEHTMGGISGDRLSGRLVIAGSSLTGTLLLTHTAVKLRRAYEGIDVHLKLDDSYQSFESGEIDIALRVINDVQDRVISEPLLNVGMGLYASADYLARNPVMVNDVDFRTHDTVRAASDRDWASLSATAPHLQFSNAKIHVLDSKYAELAAVKAGMGIGYLPNFAVKLDRAQGTLIRLLPATNSTLCYNLCYPVSASKRALFGQVRKMLIDHVESHFKDDIEVVSSGEFGVDASAKKAS